MSAKPVTRRQAHLWMLAGTLSNAGAAGAGLANIQLGRPWFGAACVVYGALAWWFLFARRFGRWL